VKKSKTQTKKGKPKNKSKIPVEENKEDVKEDYRLTPTQITIIYLMRKFDATWQEIASRLNISCRQLERKRQKMNLDGELENITSAMRELVNVAVFNRAVGMKKKKKMRRVKRTPTGEVDEKGNPIYVEEITEEETLSHLAPDIAAAQLWYEMNDTPMSEIVPNFKPISEFPSIDE
jgi:hypothetical protein